MRRRGKRRGRTMCGGREVTWVGLGISGAAIGSLAGGAVNPGVRTAEEGGREIRIQIEIKIEIKIKITSRSRSGVVERLSMRGRWDEAPLAPLWKGGEIAVTATTTPTFAPILAVALEFRSGRRSASGRLRRRTGRPGQFDLTCISAHYFLPARP